MPLNLTLPPAAALNPLTRLQLTLEALTEPELLVLQATASSLLINRHIAEIRQATPEHRKASPATPRPMTWTRRIGSFLRRVRRRGGDSQEPRSQPSDDEGRALVRLTRSLDRLRFFSWAGSAACCKCAAMRTATRSIRCGSMEPSPLVRSTAMRDGRLQWPTPFCGTMARVRFYARALSAAEIKAAAGDRTAPEPSADG